MKTGRPGGLSGMPLPVLVCEAPGRLPEADDLADPPLADPHPTASLSRGDLPPPALEEPIVRLC